MWKTNIKKLRKEYETKYGIITLVMESEGRIQLYSDNLKINNVLYKLNATFKGIAQVWNLEWNGQFLKSINNSESTAAARKSITLLGAALCKVFTDEYPNAGEFADTLAKQRAIEANEREISRLREQIDQLEDKSSILKNVISNTKEGKSYDNLKDIFVE